MATLLFAAGTLEIQGLPQGASLPETCVWDERSASFRAPAMEYAPIVLALRRQGVEIDDQARRYEELAHGARFRRVPRPYQTEALEAWRRASGRGVVVLPTGAGKSEVALLAIDDKRRSTLVVAPTLDLVRQWYDLLRATFPMKIGVVGGGEHDVQPFTVTTYDSAHLHMESFGARFGLVVFDEVHHLPGEAYQLAAKLCLAPFRLGLSATPERLDLRHLDLDTLVGPTVYRKDIGDLSGEYLAEYDVRTVVVELDRAERDEYETERALYLAFLRKNGIRMSAPQGWSQFIMRAGGSLDGRRAFKAYRRQREIAFAAQAKLDCVEGLLELHRQDRAIVFTQDNATAYTVARRFLVPIITHQTPVRERSRILERFSSGAYGAIATSKVLNEGIDVPEANVAVILSGSGSVREHVQRLGRVLRPREGKRAILYEVVSGRTGEESTSERRRDHDAYRGA